MARVTKNSAPNGLALGFEATLWSAAEKLKGKLLSGYQTGDALGEVHAFIERAQVSDVEFYDLSNTANRLNLFLRDHGLEIDKEQKRDLATRIISVLNARRAEADADDFSRMAWLAIHSGQEALARDYVQAGLTTDGGNYHVVKLAQRLGIPF